MSFLHVSTPGRICLFGEHQDYLGLPVIAAGIDRRMEVEARLTDHSEFLIYLPDIDQRISLPLPTGRLTYTIERDYFRSACNVLSDEGVIWRKGLEARFTSKIPINAGTSSSAALVLSWVKILLLAAGDSRADDRAFIARMAHRAEVMEFDEPGGMMDQYACCFGNVIHLNTVSGETQTFQPDLGAFVLGDSGQPKDTLGLLGSLKALAREGVARMKQFMPLFDLHTTPLAEVAPYLARLPQRHCMVLEANLIDRDLLKEALALLQADSMDHEAFGSLLNKHHLQLSRSKQTSTPKIDRMLQAALNAGALGGKINGSGGGGCMFAYAPHDPEKVAAAIKNIGARAWVVRIEDGIS